MTDSVDELSKVPRVYTAISQVQGALAKQGIDKAQTNRFDKYKFRGIDDVYNALAPLLADAGLVIIPQMLDCKSVERASQGGKPMIHTTVRVDYLIYAASDGSSVTAKAFGEAIDRGDKSLAKASTAAFKYLMFQLFCIPVEGSADSDSDSHEVTVQVITAEQVSHLRSAFFALDMQESAVIKHYGIGSLEQMTPAMFDHLSTKMRERGEAEQESAGENTDVV